MERCTKCGQINLANASVCSQCGAKLNENPSIEELKNFSAQKLNINQDYFSKSAEFDCDKFKNAAFFGKENSVEKNEETVAANKETFTYRNENQSRNVPERIHLQDLSKKSEKKVVNNVSFEDEFDMCDMPPVTYADNARVIPPEDKTSLRNTALLAVVLAILVDAILIICLLTYFKGFAQKIVDVDYNISGKTGSVISNDYVYVNGHYVRL